MAQEVLFKWFGWMIPSLICFGPFFIVNDWHGLHLEYIGWVMLAFGLVLMFSILRAQSAEISKLRQMISEQRAAVDGLRYPN